MKGLWFHFRTVGIIAFLFIYSHSSQAQNLSVGIQGGLALNEDLQSGFEGDSRSKKYTFGPVLEYEWASGVALELSVLYRRVGYFSHDFHAPLELDWQVRANAWKSPLLVKYYLCHSTHFARPFVSGGYVFKLISNAREDTNRGEMIYSPTSSNWNYVLIKERKDADVVHNPVQGVTFGGGLHLRSKRTGISPEIRYTKWFTVPFDTTPYLGYGAVKSSTSQWEFLLKLSFDAFRGRPVQ
jgi:hypothetical protein